jgi:hypothetical protein
MTWSSVQDIRENIMNNQHQDLNTIFKLCGVDLSTVERSSLLEMNYRMAARCAIEKAICPAHVSVHNADFWKYYNQELQLWIVNRRISRSSVTETNPKLGTTEGWYGSKIEVANPEGKLFLAWSTWQKTDALTYVGDDGYWRSGQGAFAPWEKHLDFLPYLHTIVPIGEGEQIRPLVARQPVDVVFDFNSKVTIYLPKDWKIQTISMSL